MIKHGVVGLLAFGLATAGCAGGAGGKDIDYLLERGSTAYQEGRLGEAERFLNQAVERDETISEAWFLLGNVHFRYGRFPAAVTAYERTLQYESDHGSAWHNLALTRVQQAADTAEAGLEALSAESPGAERLLDLRRELMFDGVRE